jgi:AefR-like transcriptional repressor, C-terminal domain
VVSEAVRTPELGDLFYRRGPGLMAERLAGYLEVASKRGELRCDDPWSAARLFLGAVASRRSCCKARKSERLRRLRCFAAQRNSRQPLKFGASREITDRRRLLHEN